LIIFFFFFFFFNGRKYFICLSYIIFIISKIPSFNLSSSIIDNTSYIPEIRFEPSTKS